jgi:transposase
MTIHLRLPRAQARRVKRRLRKTRCRIEALRCRILLLLQEGCPASAVAEIAGCVRATVYRTVYRFEDLGEDGLRDQRTWREPAKVTRDIERRLLEYVEQRPGDLGWHRSTWTLELLSLQLEQDTGIRLCGSWIRALLRDLGCRRGRPRAGLRVPVRGRRKVLKRIGKLVRGATAEEEVFYADEADVHLNPRIGPTYMLRGWQPLVLTPGKNVKRYVFGAWNVRTGAVVHRVMHGKNSEAFVAFIEHLRQSYRRARVLHVVLDNYIIHKSRRTLRHLRRLDGRVRLHFLPPYSPQENPIERLWKQMHDHVTRNHRHREIETLATAVDRFLEAVQPFPGTKVSTIRAAA